MAALARVPRGSFKIVAQHGRRMAAAVVSGSFLSVATRSADFRAFAAAPSSPFESLQFEDVKVGDGPKLPHRVSGTLIMPKNHGQNC